MEGHEEAPSSTVGTPFAKTQKRGPTAGQPLPPESPLRIPFLRGWKREVVQRQTGGSSDTYYFGPSGKKYRSIPEIVKTLEAGKDADSTLGKENFSFAKHVLGYEEPGMDVYRAAHFVKGRPLDSPLPKKPKISKSLDSTKKKSTPLKTTLTAGQQDNNGSSDAPTLDNSTKPKQLRIDSNTEDSDDSNDASVEKGKCACGRCAISCPEATVLCCGNCELLKMVKTDKYPCIAQHPFFKKIVLDMDALSQTRLLLGGKAKNASIKSLLNAPEPLNITWRYVAYKQFVSWVNVTTTTGGKVEVAVPSCVVQAVRKVFPETDGMYNVNGYET